MHDVIVIGGGASGMMAAGRAAFLGKKVLLLEKNAKVGEKLSITGGARCNITNATHDVHKLLANYGSASQFLFSSFSQFGVKDTFAFFESLGLPLVVQANNRVFPATQKAADVVAALKKYMKTNDVEVKTNSPVEKVCHVGAEITGVQVQGKMYAAKHYIFSTGGVSHPETGSTGDGFSWLKELGHTVKPPTPTIVPLKTSDAWSHVLSGISVDGAKITFFLDGKKSFSKTGKILFTHFGLSGPLILNSAGTVGDLLSIGNVTASIDVYPGLNAGQLDKKIIEQFAAHKNKQLKNALAEIVPPGMAPGILKLLSDGKHQIHFGAKVQMVDRETRKKITSTLKSLPIMVTGLMWFDRAVVADGGAVLEEIDTRNFRSKIVKNLSVTGDLLHINRPSGGYSLQLCWTTGFVAGSHV
ncbi:MAG TPA: aminoacetone oxidase family FAD-binding enzyme [Negativicutes bacterium]|nr:aminoacetone oxidase family FAD-binding enzyme [Negativicutes bacterium]